MRMKVNLNVVLDNGQPLRVECHTNKSLIEVVGAYDLSNVDVWPNLGRADREAVLGMVDDSVGNLVAQ